MLDLSYLIHSKTSLVHCCIVGTIFILSVPVLWRGRAMCFQRPVCEIPPSCSQRRWETFVHVLLPTSAGDGRGAGPRCLLLEETIRNEWIWQSLSTNEMADSHMSQPMIELVTKNHVGLGLPTFEELWQPSWHGVTAVVGRPARATTAWKCQVWEAAYPHL